MAIDKKQTKAIKKKNTQYYIDDKEFYRVIKQYKEKCNKIEDVFYNKNKKQYDELEALGKKRKEILSIIDEKIVYPQIPDYIGECFFKIANKLGNHPSFSRYTWRDEMIGDGYEMCLRRVLSFDPEKYFKPFAYFTQICWFAAVARIKMENKQLDIRKSVVHNSGIMWNMDAATVASDDRQYVNSFLDFLHEVSGHTKSDAESTEDKKPVITKKTKYQMKLALEKQKEIDEAEEHRKEFGDRSVSKDEIKNSKIFADFYSLIDDNADDLTDEEY